MATCSCHAFLPSPDVIAKFLIVDVNDVLYKQVPL